MAERQQLVAPAAGETVPVGLLAKLGLLLVISAICLVVTIGIVVTYAGFL